MTPAEWLESIDPAAMLKAVSATSSARKLRLFAWRMSEITLSASPTAPSDGGTANEQESKSVYQAIEVAHLCVQNMERFADREISAKRLRNSVQHLQRLYPHWTAAVCVVRDLTFEVIDRTSDCSSMTGWLQARPTPVPLDLAVAALRELFGNPFLSLDFESRWKTDDVMGVARGIYEDRAFERMPILADALMDAGCENSEIIAHCGGPGPHVRGCWVVDLILGKE